MICKLEFISHKGVFEIVNNTWHIMYLATHEITKKWTIPLRNWGRVLGELEIMYLNRLTVGETWQITVFIVYCKKIERLFFKPLAISFFITVVEFTEIFSQSPEKCHTVVAWCCTISYAIFTVSYTENTETLSAGTVRTPSVISAASPLV